MQIGDFLKLVKSIITFIIHCHSRQPKHKLQLIKRASYSLKFDEWTRRLFIHQLEQNSYDDFKALNIFSKLGQIFS